MVHTVNISEKNFAAYCGIFGNVKLTLAPLYIKRFQFILLSDADTLFLVAYISCCVPLDEAKDKNGTYEYEQKRHKKETL